MKMEMVDIAPIIIIAVILIALAILFTFVPVMLWISALAAGVKVGLFTLVGMRLRRVVPNRVINPLIKAHKAGLTVKTSQLESHYLAGGNVDRVVNALIAAHRANITLPFERGAAIDLAGRNVLEAVQMSVNPKVIETPFIAGIAMDGIEVKAMARVTVRANIDRLVGGASEETVIARVGEGVVSTIGSSETHKQVLENPDSISHTVLEKGLDAGTAFEILSIDIADVDVGKNIGANLQSDQAEADKRIAQAKAEERRAMAVAQEQEMTARVEEMRAQVVEAEAEVPQALAEALRSGNLGVMDYMNYKNINADTDMRETIGRLTMETMSKRRKKNKFISKKEGFTRMEEIFELLFKNPFLLLLIIGYLTTVFRGKSDEQKEREKQPKRTPPKKTTESSPKTPETHTVKMSSIEAQRKEQLERLQTQLETKMPSQDLNLNDYSTLGTTISDGESKQPVKQKMNKNKIQQRLNQRGLVESVIMAEVLGSPRAKKRHHRQMY